MNREEAFSQLCDYWALASRAEKLPRFTGERSAALKALNERLPTVNKILRELAPDQPLIRAQWIGDHVAAWPRISRALDLINGWREMTDNWTGEGPSLPLGLLDPMVSGPATPLWTPGKYRQAVADAASGVNHFTQNRLGRHDVSDSDLMGHAFSDKKPEDGKPRLRCPGDQRSMSVRSMQHGAMVMSIGVFQAIRNPAVHMTGDWNPVTAAEHLAALSIVARWVRNWNLVEYVPPPPDYKALSIVIEQMAKTGD